MTHHSGHGLQPRTRWLVWMDGINAGGSCKKRKKRDRPPVEEEEADDESKMDKFFDLIHNLGQSLKSHSGWVAIAENNRNKRIKGGWEPGLNSKTLQMIMAPPPPPPSMTARRLFHLT